LTATFKPAAIRHRDDQPDGTVNLPTGGGAELARATPMLVPAMVLFELHWEYQSAMTGLGPKAEWRVTMNVLPKQSFGMTNKSGLR
jgi:hypothetical protein